jgi:1-acyl-sn-glycerol-3-phosphate acyltransferase
MRNVNIRTAARILGVLNPRRRYHRAEIRHVERLPAKGGAVIVSNHGRLDLDYYILAGLILRLRGRLVRVMADHLWFRLPHVRNVIWLSGAVDGTRENAIEILRRGEMMLTYPGGVREIMSSRFGQEHIDWRGRTGFASVAITSGVPVIPVVSVGVNNGFIFLTSGKLLGRFLYQRVLRMGRAYEDYRDPLVVGLVPLPLPLSMAVHFPLPCKVRYVVGEPVYPAENLQDAEGKEAETELARRVAESMERLIEQYGRPARSTEGPNFE